MTIYASFEDRLSTIAANAWEQWTQNGVGMDRDEMTETGKSATDAANNCYVEGINDLEWLAATVARLRGQ